ncbi:MAG TPA: SMI1/KNR4 family protein [Candidatus Dormibacteraeota bacterium]|nr:SMI1/KNR4 family protein [Candidatus Dormibacteraeota bacterium]
MTLIDDLAVLNDRSCLLGERLGAVVRLAQIRGAYTEEEYSAAYLEYRAQSRIAPETQARWDLQQRVADEAESDELRVACIEAFAAISNGQYVIDLRPLTGLKTRNATVRRAAINAATQVRLHPRHHEHITHQLAECEQNVSTLTSLVSWWGARPGVLQTIETWRHHHDPHRRSEAAYCLAWLGDTSLAVHNLGHDPDTGVRRSAAATIGRFGLGTSEEADALRAVLKDTDVSKEVRQSLMALGFQPIPRPGRASPPAGIAADPDRAQWWQTLAGLSRRLLGREENRIAMDEAVVKSGWLGLSPASDAEIEHLERRLGRALPPSFRQYLRVTNGWLRGPSYPERWYGTSQIGWFRDLEPVYLHIWTEEIYTVPDAEYFVYGPKQETAAIRREYLRACLQVSEQIDGYVYLLNPEIITLEGEWEAWVLGSKLAGAIRYRSWHELVAAEAAKLAH